MNECHKEKEKQDEKQNKGGKDKLEDGGDKD